MNGGLVDGDSDVGVLGGGAVTEAYGVGVELVGGADPDERRSEAGERSVDWVEPGIGRDVLAGRGAPSLDGTGTAQRGS